MADAESAKRSGMTVILPIAAGGAIGAVLRFLMTAGVARLLATSFPWGTLSVNVLGSFMMGVLVELFALKLNASQELRAFLTTGILGGFTTFSAFSADAMLLIERNDLWGAGLYTLGSVLLSIGALFVGLVLVRALA
jgi:CrcB protein